jgi:hypothetical protein
VFGAGLAGRVEDQVAQQFAGAGVDDADEPVVDEEPEAGALMRAADADVMQPGVIAEGHDAGRSPRAWLDGGPAAGEISADQGVHPSSADAVVLRDLGLGRSPEHDHPVLRHLSRA